MTISIEEIKRKKTDYESIWSKAHSEMDTDQQYIELEFEPDVPQKYPVRVPPTAREWTFTAMRHFCLDKCIVRMIPRGQSETARKKDGRCERFLNYWFNQQMLQVRQLPLYATGLGQCIIRLTVDPTYMGKEPSRMSTEDRAAFEERRLFHLPVKLDTPHPRNVFCSPYSENMVPDDVFIVYPMTVAEARGLARARGWDWKTDKEGTTEIEWVEYMDSESVCFLLDGEPVAGGVRPNVLRFVPFVNIPSGFGFPHHDGKLEYIYRSIIAKRRDMLKAEVANLSQREAIYAFLGWPRYKLVGRQEDIDMLYGDASEIDINDPTKLLRALPDGQVDIEILQGGSLPPGFLEHTASIMDFAHVPPILAGQRPTGIYSAKAFETVLGTAKPLYKDTIRHIEQGLAIAGGMALRIIEQVYQHPVAFLNFGAGESGKQWETISKSDIDGNYQVDYKLLADPPEALDMRKMLGQNLRNGGSISRLTELTQYHDLSMEEAEEEMAQMYAERAMEEQGIREFLSRGAMERAGMVKELELLAEAERRAAGPRPPKRQREMQDLDVRGVRKLDRSSPELEQMPGLQQMNIENQGV